MRDIRSVEQTLSQNLSWHRARIKFVAAFIVALVTVKNIHWLMLRHFDPSDFFGYPL
jgi:hypothetical protein